jgi:hypothetical protein
MFMSTAWRAVVQPGLVASRVWGAAALLLATLALAPPAAAQEPPATPTAQDYAQVTRACKTDYARFCEAKSDLPATGRDQAICLKYHRQDLSLPCRTAVSAVSH